MTSRLTHCSLPNWLPSKEPPSLLTTALPNSLPSHYRNCSYGQQLLKDAEKDTFMAAQQKEQEKKSNTRTKIQTNIDSRTDVSSELPMKEYQNNRDDNRAFGMRIQKSSTYENSINRRKKSLSVSLLSKGHSHKGTQEYQQNLPGKLATTTAPTSVSVKASSLSTANYDVQLPAPQSTENPTTKEGMAKMDDLSYHSSIENPFRECQRDIGCSFTPTDDPQHLLHDNYESPSPVLIPSGDFFTNKSSTKQPRLSFPLSGLNKAASNNSRNVNLVNTQPSPCSKKNNSTVTDVQQRHHSGSNADSFSSSFSSLSSRDPLSQDSLVEESDCNLDSKSTTIANRLKYLGSSPLVLGYGMQSMSNEEDLLPSTSTGGSINCRDSNNQSFLPVASFFSSKTVQTSPDLLLSNGNKKNSRNNDFSPYSNSEAEQSSIISDPSSYLKQRLNAIHNQQHILRHQSPSRQRQLQKASNDQALSNHQMTVNDYVEQPIESSNDQHCDHSNRCEDTINSTKYFEKNSVRIQLPQRGMISHVESETDKKEQSKSDTDIGRPNRASGSLKQATPTMSFEAKGPPPRPNRTKSQLVALQEKIAKFEGQLQTETEHRKAAEEGKLSVLKEAIGSLEKTLAAEVERRLEAHKTIQIGFDKQLILLEGNINQTLEEKTRLMISSMEALVLRLRDAQAEATGAIQVQAQKLIQLKEEIEAAANETDRVKDYITSEFQARRQRGEIISDKLMELEKQIESRVTIEKSVRERDVIRLERKMSDLKQQHLTLDDAFEQELASKFLDLKNALREETHAREQADDDIVQALNYYTSALQSALRIANST